MNLAIFLPNWIGDVVMATPAIRALREQHVGVRCIAICRPYVREVLAGAPWFDDYILLDRGIARSQSWPAVGWKLRREHIDLAVLFPNSLRPALVASLAGSKRIVGFRRYLRGWMLTTALEPVRDEHGRLVPTPVIDDYNRIAMAAGTSSPGHRMELFTTPEDEAAADAVCAKLGIHSGDEVVCLNPGAAFGASKHWPAQSFAQLAIDLIRTRGCKVLTLCGPNEREQARQIVALANHPNVHSVADEKLSLGLTKALVRRCALLVTTDSGPRHFAAAFDRPVVTLYGPTFIDWTRTYFDREINLQEQVPCGPCQLRVCPTDHACMTQLSPRKVLAAARELLDRTTMLTERKAS